MLTLTDEQACPNKYPATLYRTITTIWLCTWQVKMRAPGKSPPSLFKADAWCGACTQYEPVTMRTTLPASDQAHSGGSNCHRWQVGSIGWAQAGREDGATRHGCPGGDF